MNDGGRAFPNRGDNTPGHPYYDGMSLRDYFAGQALIGLLANSTSHFGKADPTLASPEAAYIVADAMLAKRDKS